MNDGCTTSDEFEPVVVVQFRDDEERAVTMFAPKAKLNRHTIKTIHGCIEDEYDFSDFVQDKDVMGLTGYQLSIIRLIKDVYTHRLPHPAQFFCAAMVGFGVGTTPLKLLNVIIKNGDACDHKNC